MNVQRPIQSPSVRSHKRQVAWQILVPFFLVTALILATAVLVASGTAANRTWADVSTIWLIAPLLVFAIIFVVVLFFLVFLLAKILQVTPRYTGKAQDFFGMISKRVRTIADGTTKPVVWAQQVGAIIRSIFKA